MPFYVCGYPVAYMQILKKRGDCKLLPIYNTLRLHEVINIQKAEVFYGYA